MPYEMSAGNAMSDATEKSIKIEKHIRQRCSVKLVKQYFTQFKGSHVPDNFFLKKAGL